MAAKTVAYTANVAKITTELPSLLDSLEVEMQQLSQKMDRLKKDGIIYASEHWRRDNAGVPKYLTLLFPQKPGEARKREYIGCNVDRIEAARASIARAKEYDALSADFTKLHNRLHEITRAVNNARLYLIGQTPRPHYY